MSDLQCPASVVLVADDLLASSSIAHCAAVYATPELANDAAAETLARSLSCRLSLLADARDTASLSRAIQELSDVYRGERIAVLAPRERIRELLGRAGDATSPVVVAIDSSGWTVLSEPTPD